MNFKLTSEQKHLTHLFGLLNPQDQVTLISFAEFLREKTVANEPPDEVQAIVEPVEIPRPEEESVIAAMKRLSATYPMLEKSAVLHKSAGLLSEHMMQGKAAKTVIDELENIFLDAYNALSVDESAEKAKSS